MHDGDSSASTSAPEYPIVMARNVSVSTKTKTKTIAITITTTTIVVVVNEVHNKYEY